MIKTSFRYFGSIFIALLVSFSISSPSWSCTRLLHVDKKQGVVVGRNMDWFQEMGTNLFVYPRGIERNGVDPINPLRWVSKYGSIAAAYHDLSTTDGMNEKGFSAHVLWLEDTNYGNRDVSKYGLSVLMWTQFYLDNFQTVAEAVHFTQSNTFQLLPFVDPVTKMDVKIHLAIEDASGDSAIIEYKNGLPMIYHGQEYNVLTNDPTYDIQLQNMHHYQGLGGDDPIPGSDSPLDRFVRAAYYEKRLPEAATTMDEVSDVISILENVSHPHGYFRGTTAIEKTIWRTVSDLTHHVYYYNSSVSMNFTQLDQFNLNVGAPIMKLDLVNHPKLRGDVTHKFKPMYLVTITIK